MASHNVMHRDIKPDNVLLTDEGAPVLTDFSLAKVVEATTEQPAATKAADKAGKEKAGKKRKHDKGASDKGGAAVHTSAMGTPTYTAPEIVSGGSDYGTQADVWSMGVVFYELFHGEMPPPDPNPEPNPNPDPDPDPDLNPDSNLNPDPDQARCSRASKTSTPSSTSKR